MPTISADRREVNVTLPLPNFSAISEMVRRSAAVKTAPGADEAAGEALCAAIDEEAAALDGHDLFGF